MYDHLEMFLYMYSINYFLDTFPSPFQSIKLISSTTYYQLPKHSISYSLSIYPVRSLSKQSKASSRYSLFFIVSISVITIRNYWKSILPDLLSSTFFICFLIDCYIYLVMDTPLTSPYNAMSSQSYKKPEWSLSSLENTIANYSLSG